MIAIKNKKKKKKIKKCASCVEEAIYGPARNSQSSTLTKLPTKSEKH